MVVDGLIELAEPEATEEVRVDLLLRDLPSKIRNHLVRKEMKDTDEFLRKLENFMQTYTDHGENKELLYSLWAMKIKKDVIPKPKNEQQTEGGNEVEQRYNVNYMNKTRGRGRGRFNFKGRSSGRGRGWFSNQYGPPPQIPQNQQGIVQPTAPTEYAGCFICSTE